MKLAAMIKKMCPSDSELSIPAKNCYRMVILGSSKVGKSSIVSRFLTGRFDDAYTPTIEDFHRKFYSIRGEVYQLDILDTSGNHPFPAMRRLSILTGEWGSRPGSGRGRELRHRKGSRLLGPGRGPEAPSAVPRLRAKFARGELRAPSSPSCWCPGDWQPGDPEVKTNLSCSLGTAALTFSSSALSPQETFSS